MDELAAARSPTPSDESAPPPMFNSPQNGNAKGLEVKMGQNNNNNNNKGAILCCVGVVSFGFCCCLVVIGLIVVFVIALLSVEEDFVLEQAVVNEETRVGDAYIGLFIIGDMSAVQRSAFDQAAARWSAIVGDTLGSFTGDVIEPGEEMCDGDMLANATFVADHLIIGARIERIDGVNGILGFAGPCLLDFPTFFPIIGEMVFDLADVEALIDDGVFNDVILHEMGHVLGLGTLWDRSIQGAITGFSSPFNRLLQDPVLGSDFFGQPTVLQTTVQPKFVGQAAIAQFRIAANNNGLQFVPVEDGTLNGKELFGNNRANGAGSIDGHWDLEPLDFELMTFQIDPQAPDHPLSAISLASLADMGYEVDLALADDFSIPSRRSEQKRLRGKVYYMNNDVLKKVPKIALP